MVGADAAEQQGEAAAREAERLERERLQVVQEIERDRQLDRDALHEMELHQEQRAEHRSSVQYCMVSFHIFIFTQLTNV